MEWMESHLQDPGSQFFIWAFCPTLWADKNGYFQQLQNQTQNHNQNKIVMSREKRLFPTITKSGERCKNLRLQSIGWLNNLYNFFFFETRIRCDWISQMHCILSLESEGLHHSLHVGCYNFIDQPTQPRNTRTILENSRTCFRVSPGLIFWVTSGFVMCVLLLC